MCFSPSGVPIWRKFRGNVAVSSAFSFVLLFSVTIFPVAVFPAGAFPVAEFSISFRCIISITSAAPFLLSWDNHNTEAADFLPYHGWRKMKFLTGFYEKAATFSVTAFLFVLFSFLLQRLLPFCRYFLHPVRILQSVPVPGPTHQRYHLRQYGVLWPVLSRKGLHIQHFQVHR